MSKLPLGQKVDYPNKYDSGLLFPIPRDQTRDNLENKQNLLFFGADIWNCYEFSWLSQNGVPNIRILEIVIPCNSEFIIESKSLKLYLGSFNNERFLSEDDVLQRIIRDISDSIKTEIEIYSKGINNFTNKKITSFEEAISIDNLDISFNYDLKPESSVIKSENIIVEENLYTDLMKSNCLVTSQPDWASVLIKYKGRKVIRESLLKYILSFRNHNEFHEQCVERIFCDLYEILSPSYLSVYARYTRRGGIDINPFRSTDPHEIYSISNERFARQ